MMLDITSSEMSFKNDNLLRNLLPSKKIEKHLITKV